jgi:hypothetical protein
MNKRLKWATGIVLVGIIALYAAWVLLPMPRDNCVITVSATFRVSSESDGYIWKTIKPVQEAQWASSSHEAPYTRAVFKEGEMIRSTGYGVHELEGAFSWREIKEIWPDAPVDQDWAFGVGLFNTRFEGNYRMYLNVQADVETGSATADFSVFYQGSANPCTVRWEGKIGDKIVLALDY